MRIMDAFEWNGMYLVICTGEGITDDLSCTTLIAGGKRYRVKRCEVNNSFSDHLMAGIEIEGPELPPLGECFIEK